MGATRLRETFVEVRGKILGADLTINNNSVFADSALELPLEANKTYAFRVWLDIIESDPAADIKITFIVPSLAVIKSIVSNNGTGIVLRVGSGVTIQASLGTVNSRMPVDGYVATGANPGTIMMQVAQTSAQPTNLTLSENSYMKLTLLN